MNNFTYSYPVKVYFGKDTTETALTTELKKYGKNVLLAYGGGSVKKNGVYDAVKGILEKEGKTVLISQESCRIQLMQKYRKAPKWRKKITLISFWQ